MKVADMQKIIVSGILRNDDKVLIAKRSSTKKIAPGKWHLPGGHIEFGEEPEDALKREFSEEFQIEIVPQYVVRTFSYIWGDAHEVGISFAVSSTAPLSDDIYFDQNDNEQLAWIREDEVDAYFANDDNDNRTLKTYFKQKDA